MVKLLTTALVVEAEGDENIMNENGKRPVPDQAKEGNKRIKTKSLYRQPTANEMNRLMETESLFNSNLFRLQVEEVLAEVKLKEKTIKNFQEWFTALRQHLLTISEDGIEYDLSTKSLTKHCKLKIPLCKTLQTTKVMFKFNKFTDVKIIGSYALGCPINSKLIVDLQVEVPAETYTKNDSINYKYHQKRAAYIAYVASHLNKLDIIEEMQYTYDKANETKPTIILKPKGKLNKHLSVKIHFACELETFKLHRFSPSRNNLREMWLLDTESKENTDIGPPTPYYNSSILYDLTSTLNGEFLGDILMNCENLKQAIVLLKIWVRQRKLQISGYMFSMFIAYLVRLKRINNIMSSYQIVRNVWILLRSSEWDTKGVSLCKGENTPPLEEFHEHFPVVFLDTTGYYNIFWQTSKGTYDALKRESSLAVDMLDNTKMNSFIPLFMTTVSPLLQFDHIIKFKNIQKLKESIMERTPKERRINYGLDELALVVDTLYSLLSRGLTNRVDLILPIVEADNSWPVKKVLDKVKLAEYAESLSFGLILNCENASSIVDRGPAANLPEAEQFRAFWGDKSELRRFQDGTITEACVWEAESRAQRRAVARQIVDHLLQLKYDISPDEVFHVCSQLDGLTMVKEQGREAEEAAAVVLTTFDELRRDLRALSNLPLDISAVNGTSAVFSCCEPMPANDVPARSDDKAERRGAACLLRHADTAPAYVPANRAVVELTHSGKWPGDLEAFRCLKAAFNLQIAARLRTQYSLVTQVYPTHVDVLKNNLVFRLTIAHPKEVTLLRREVHAGVAKFKETDESLQLQVETVLLPRLRGALHGLHTKYPSFGPTACLFKRWVSAQLLHPHLPPTLCELLVAAVYLHCAPLTPPAQPTLAFLRVLTLLADTHWKTQMLLLDFNEDMTCEEIMELERKFGEREVGSAPMHVVTSYDGEHPGVWSAPVGARALARAQVLARATAQYAQGALLDDMKDTILGVFVPSLAGYDVLIHLRRQLVPHWRERLDVSPPKEKKRAGDDALLLPVVEFDPVQKYLDELRSAYDEFALFFHDTYGGDVVAVLWKPGVDDLRDLQILDAHALKPVVVGGETKYRLNKEAILEDFRILGTGLVTDVVVQADV